MKVEGDITCWLCVYFIYVSVVVSESIFSAMPSGSALISGGISLGVIASFISGVYYVLIAGLKWMGKLQDSLQTAEEKRADKWSCARCGRDLSIVKTGPSRRVQCARCSSLVCRNCCSKTSAASWICSNCRKYRDITLQTGEWFYEQLKKRFYSTVATIPGNPNQDVEVRDFMERIVEEMVGGELDSVSLRPLSEHPEYVKFCETYHDELAHTLAKFSLALQMAVTDKILPDSDSPSAIHEELKELIKRIIKEAMMLPSLQNYSNGSINKEPLNGEVNELEKKSYEDILATAVINKIVERYQNELYNYEINNSRSSLRDTNGNVVRRRKLRRQRLTAGLVEGTNSSDSEGSAAYTNDEYSWSGSSRTDPLSLTIEECIEEVVTKYTSDEDPEEQDSELKHFLSGLNFRRRQRAPFPEFGMDVVDKRHSSSSSSEDDANEENDDIEAHRVGVEVISPVESWEENWLFQRRRLKTACLSQSMPVPMLVPNPSQDEPRARIGDIDIDETSDLSDCSDSALEDIIGSETDVKRISKLNLSINRETSSDENSDSEDDFFLTNYNRNVIKSIDNMKPKVNGVCNGNVDHNLTVNKIKVNIVNEEDMDTEFCSNALDSASPSQTLPSNCNITEARNHELIVPQVDSGEGSLEMQQDREYTVEYDAPVRVHVNQNQKSASANTDSCDKQTNPSSENNTLPETKDNGLPSREKPTPKPRSTNTAHQQEKTEEKSNSINNEEETDGKENFDTLLMTPPRPGTIAEREHLKWQKAVPLTNNPYSKENIERRQRERLLLSRQSSGDISVEFPELTGANDSSVVHIDCSGRKPDYKQYGRDYYINTGGVKKDNADKDKEREKSVEDEKIRKDSNGKSSTVKSTVKPEDKPQVSVRVEVEVGRWPNSSSVSSSGNNTVSSVETRTHITDLKDDEQHLTTISTSTASANNDNLNDKHHKVTTVSTWNSKNKNNKDNSNYISLPSVKQLAKQFSTTESNEQVAPVITTPVQKRLEVQTSPIKQVHSLTARCISKEFREGLRAANQPKSYQVKPIEKIDNNSGNISDDSGTASPTPSGGNPKLYNSIAFWEQMKSSRQ